MFLQGSHSHKAPDSLYMKEMFHLSTLALRPRSEHCESNSHRHPKTEFRMQKNTKQKEIIKQRRKYKSDISYLL